MLDGRTVIDYAADTDGFRGPNQLKSSTDVTLYRENDQAVPVYVSGTLARNSGEAWVETALDYFDQHKAAYRMDNPAEQLSVKKLEVDDLGMRHIRFDQLHDGIGWCLGIGHDPRGPLRSSGRRRVCPMLGVPSS